MASSLPNKNLPIRAAAILTNAEVKGNNVDINLAAGAWFNIEVSFTKGSLTNGIFAFYLSMDGSTWFDAADVGGNHSYTLTADASKAYLVNGMGYKFITVGVTGTGTLTSSSATVTARYQRKS